MNKATSTTNLKNQYRNIFLKLLFCMFISPSAIKSQSWKRPFRPMIDSNLVSASIYPRRESTEQTYYLPAVQLTMKGIYEEVICSDIEKIKLYRLRWECLSCYHNYTRQPTRIILNFYEC